MGWNGGSDQNSWQSTRQADYLRLRDQQKEIDDLIASYTKPATGFGGFSYAPAGKSPLPNRLGQGYNQAANYILGGSQGAQEQLRQQYESMLRSRSGGIGSAFGQAMQRGGAGLAGQGVSPQLQQLLMGGQKSNLLASFGEGVGADEADYHSSLAGLIKGTGTELAGLKTKELSDALNYIVGKASADASKADPFSTALNLATGIAGLKTSFG